MSYIVWLVLRVIGMAWLVLFLMDAANKLAFSSAAMSLPYGLLGIGLTILVSAVLLWWGSRVIWRRVEYACPVGLRWRMQWLLAAVLVLCIAFGGWQGWQDEMNLGAQMGGMVGQTTSIILAYKISGALIDLVFAVVPLLVVSLVRLIVRRRRSERTITKREIDAVS